jgi:hypothetical protein
MKHASTFIIAILLSAQAAMGAMSLEDLELEDLEKATELGRRIDDARRLEEQNPGRELQLAQKRDAIRSRDVSWINGERSALAKVRSSNFDPQNNTSNLCKLWRVEQARKMLQRRQEIGDAALLQADPTTIKWLLEKQHLILRIGDHIDLLEAASQETCGAVRDTLDQDFSEVL